MLSSFPEVFVSFSGGRSSAAMCWLLLNHPKYRDLRKTFVFANTGQEKEETLEFVDQCDKHFGLNLVWIEAVINPNVGGGTRYKVVDFQSACRGIELFEQGCKKYGLPNPTFKWCTRELKTVILDRYRKDHGGSNVPVCIGYRVDEQDRIAGKEDQPFLFPLNELSWTKADVNNFWRQQTFDLRLNSDAEGNCLWCYKKAFRKLATVAQSNKDFFDAPMYLENMYALRGSMSSLNGRRFSFEAPSFLVFLAFSWMTNVAVAAKWLLFLAACSRQIYRHYNQTDYILRLAEQPDFRPFKDLPDQISLLHLLQMDELDKGGDCDQGCEVDFNFKREVLFHAP